MARKPTTFSDQLRTAILNGPMSRYAVAKTTGVSQGQLSRFIHGTAGLSVESLDRIWECLELEIVAPLSDPAGRTCKRTKRRSKTR